MKKLALLLAALGVMSATTFAAEPTLKITSIGQEVEIENTSGGEDIGESVLFGTMVNLSYGDWTFGVTGAKRWAVDTEDTDSLTGRLQLDAMKKFDGYSLGLRYRGEKDYDRYYLRGSWNHGFLYGSADVWYESKTNSGTDANDLLRGEIFPIGVQYNGMKLGWFVDYTKTLGGVETKTVDGKVVGGLEDSFEHQLRFYAPLYKGEKLTVQTEIRHTLHADKNFKKHRDTGDKVAYKVYDDFGRTRVYLKNNYKVNEALDVYFNYAYEFRDWASKDGKVNTDSDKYFGDIVFGWKYKF